MVLIHYYKITFGVKNCIEGVEKNKMGKKSKLELGFKIAMAMVKEKLKNFKLEFQFETTMAV